MKTIINSVIVTFLLVLPAAGAEVKAPAGWRLPRNGDFTAEWAELRAEGKRPHFIEADFDGNGVQDQAYIALSSTGRKL